jgi:fibronectin type 3 domain-containing protein
VASANAATSFVDGSVQSGQTYYYVVTAVDTSGTESGYSNQVQAVIPSP